MFKYLKENGKKSDEVWILDGNGRLKLPKGAKSILGAGYLDNLDQFDLVYRSPGVPYNLGQIQRAIKKGVRFSSATKLFFKKTPCPIIGVTGTKGKGTTASLLYKILKVAGRDVYLIGNIGTPCLNILSKLKHNSLVIFELSSFQLQDMDKSPQVAIVLGIFPDHLDWHKNFKEYWRAKANIALYQKKKDKIFYFPNERYSKLIAQKSPAKKYPIICHPESSSGSNRKMLKKFQHDILFNPAKLKIRGPHNFNNVLIATTVAKNLGVDCRIIKRVAENFRGLKYRLEFIKKIKDVSIYNDSASTNPESSVAAILSFNQPVILIAGGKDKGLDYRPLAVALKKSTAKKTFLFGGNKNKINEQINKSTVIELCDSLSEALEKALKIAYNGDVIVFSPGSASFDMFKDYKDRGKLFENLVEKLSKN